MAVRSQEGMDSDKGMDPENPSSCLLERTTTSEATAQAASTEGVSRPVAILNSGLIPHPAMARALHCTGQGQSGPPEGRTIVKSLKYAVIAALVASTVTLQPVTALAQGRDRRDRYEDKRDRDRDRYDNRRDRDRDRDDDRRYESSRDGRYDHNRYDNNRAVPRAWRNYDYRRAEPGYRRYDAARYYRNDKRYRPYRMGRNDRIYRGSDNRYYCRRDDGTTGLIVGGVAGGILGSIIAPGGSKTLGAIIGAGAGALLGREIDNGVECR